MDKLHIYHKTKTALSLLLRNSWLLIIKPRNAKTRRARRRRLAVLGGRGVGGGSWGLLWPRREAVGAGRSGRGRTLYTDSLASRKKQFNCLRLEPRKASEGSSPEPEGCKTFRRRPGPNKQNTYGCSQTEGWYNERLLWLNGQGQTSYQQDFWLNPP